MTGREQLLLTSLAHVDVALEQTSAEDMIEHFVAVRAFLFIEANRRGLGEEVRDQIWRDLVARFALRSGLRTVMALRSGS